MSQESSISRDVRMRGFAQRTDVQSAVEWVDAHAARREPETVAIDEATGRVLARDVVAGIDVPAFDRAAMDGFALRAAETDGAGDYNPLSFRVIGHALPGRPFHSAVVAGTAVRIMTGAPLPAGADAVVPAEFAGEQGQQVQITASVTPGKHVGRKGEDVKTGSRLLAAPRRLRPQDVGLIASLGFDRIDVIPRPRVRVLVTGNELVAPGKPRGDHQIYESNSSMLQGLVARDGGLIESRWQVEDRRETICEAMTAPAADIVLVSGGSSVGAEDHAPAVLASEGDLAIHGIAMRPSSPTGLGSIGRTLVFLLPGNPVSCLCAYDFFAGRAIRLMGGRRADWPYVAQQREVGRKIVSAVGRVDYCRVCLAENKLEPLALSGASILSSTTRADGFVIVPSDSEGYAPGTRVTVYLYDEEPSV